MKKKYLALVLAACMTASLAACGSTAADTSAPAATTEEVADTAAAESAEAADTAAATGEHGPSSEAAPAWEDYDARIAAIRSETDLVKREALMHEAEDELMNTWAVVPLYYYNDSYLQKTDVENIYANLFGYKYFGFAKTPTNTLDLQIASEPDKLDPALNSTVDGACLAILNFSGLFAYDENGQLVPELADSYEMSEDGMTYTFTMKDGLKWSDGEALDANDVLYSWNRLADENTAADYSYLCSVFATKDDGTLDIEASEDGKTFTAHLNAPCAYFLDLCAFPAFYPVPQQAVEAADGADTNPGAWALEAGFVGSGPFVLTEWKHNESMTYEPNPNYWAADKVSMTKINFMLSSDDTAIYNAFQDGSLQFADTIPTDMMATVKDTPEYHKIPTLGTYYCGFNVNSELFAGKTVEEAAAMREAFTLLIDRQYIVDAIAQANQEVANTFIPTGMSDGNGGEFMLSANTPINMTYLTNDSEGNVKIGEAIQQDFAMIGINVTVETREWSVFLNERKDGQFDFAREGWLADYNDPINMLEMWETTSGNNDMQFGR